MASPLASTDPAAPGTYAPPPEPSRRCPNCGTEARDAYCPHCGQEQTEVHRTLRAHADDLLDAFAGWVG